VAFELSTINDRIRKDAKGFIEECDAIYAAKVDTVAKRIGQNLKESPIVLLSGPSGSAKTTTALKIEEALKRLGIETHTVSMDNYFKTVDFAVAPRTPGGEVDYESPLCLDMDLLNEHFTQLSQGREIRIPQFVFSRQKRSASQFTPLRLGKNEIAIFEGIHALNDKITQVHPEAFKLYVSARSNVADNGITIFKGTWMRLVRRVVRDNNFRGASANFTLRLWGNVRRGEKNYISPFKHKADLRFDSSLPYEVSVMKNFAMPLFDSLPEGIEGARARELRYIIPAFLQFEELEAHLIPPASILREFIGGGIYQA